MPHLLGSADPTVQERVGDWFGISGTNVVVIVAFALAALLIWKFAPKD
jgi:hypothetical protein